MGFSGVALTSAQVLTMSDHLPDRLHFIS